MEKSAVLFKVGERKVFVPNKDGKKIELEGKRAIVNLNTDETIGIVGKNYVPVSNSQVLEHFGEVSKSIGLDYKLANGYLMRGGSESIMEIDFPGADLKVAKNDVLNLRAWLTNGFDGYSSAILELGFVRLVCTNGMVAGDKEMRMSHRHIGEVNSRLVEQFQSYLKQRVNETKIFVKDLQEKEFKDQKQMSDIITHSDFIGERYKKDMLDELGRQGKAALSAWILYNVYTRIITHVMKINQANRLGLFRKLNQEAMGWR